MYYYWPSICKRLVSIVFSYFFIFSIYRCCMYFSNNRLLVFIVLSHAWLVVTMLPNNCRVVTLLECQYLLSTTSVSDVLNIKLCAIFSEVQVLLNDIVYNNYKHFKYIFILIFFVFLCKLILGVCLTFCRISWKLYSDSTWSRNFEWTFWTILRNRFEFLFVYQFYINSYCCEVLLKKSPCT